MTKQEAINNLRAYWFGYRFASAMRVEGIPEHLRVNSMEEMAKYYGYRDALIDMKVVTWSECHEQIETKLNLKVVKEGE